MASLTGNTSGSLKKMFPPVKRKAIDAQPSFGTFLNGGTAPTAVATNGEQKKAAPKATGKKRKAISEPDTNAAAEEAQADGEKTDDKVANKKKAPAKGRGRSKKAKVDVKKEPTSDEDAEDAEDAEEGTYVPI